MKNPGRVLTAMVTPMTEGLEVDLTQAGLLAQRLVRSGSDGLVVTGTTGESATLSLEEKAALWAAVVEQVGHAATVVAGAGGNDTAASKRAIAAAERAGVDAVLAVTPYYNRPSQEGLYRHFRLLAESTSLPIILYNVPSRTGVNLLPQTVHRLVRDCANIIAVKEASGNLDQAAEILSGIESPFYLYSGDDALTLPLLSLGAYGVISVASHLVGAQMGEMIEAYLSGDPRRAARIHLRLHPLFRALFITTNPVPVKWAVGQTGLPVGGVRPPLADLSVEEQNEVRHVLASLHLV